ncbi:MAG: type I-E CRISPR-associated protein Cas5/CasD [Betaproteobacteria bacterium]|nr:type I-E CRISPR-associated protein Cas5/CasD [Betaproteobacteria bacterium]
MAFLVFQLQGPLAAWGEPAVGEYRGSADYPGESAVIGLLGAALGIRRDEEVAHAALRTGYGFAVGVQSTGRLLRDYHTAQVPGRSTLKDRPHATRRDELAVPKHELNTILSTRDYRQDAACLVAVQAFDNAPHSLDELAKYLRCPRFVLYLGRKSCPPAAPLFPQLLDAPSAREAFDKYRAKLEVLRSAHKDRWGQAALEEIGPVERIAWGDKIESGVAPDLSTPRKDRLIRRKGWQFGDRVEHVAMLDKGD